jgi:CBS domain-containing protein
MQARDFMQTDVVTVTPGTLLSTVHRLFIEEEIHGAPVVDEDGRVIGIVSTLDLSRASADELDPDAALAMTAADVMTPEVVAVTPETSVTDVAKLMRAQHIHRVLVVRDRELVGVVTTFDLLRALTDDDKPRVAQGRSC